MYVTASYTGEVAKTNCEVVTYTAVFGSTEIPSEEPTEQPKPAETDAPAEANHMTACLPLLGCVGGVVALVVAGCWAIQKLKGRKG